MTILITEDERDIRNLLKISLEENGYQVILAKNGMPPYYGKNVTLKSAVYINYLTKMMTENPAIDNSGYNTLRDIFSSEYGILDKINYAWG